MKLTYKELKEVLDDIQQYEDREYRFPKQQEILIQAAKNYLPILLHQEFIAPNNTNPGEANYG